MWSNGSPSDYENWQDGEPNDWRGGISDQFGEDIVEISDERHGGRGRWNDNVRSVCDSTVLDPLFATVSRPFWTVFRGLGAGFLNLEGKTEKTAKKREKTGKKRARYGLKKVGPMTD